MQSKGSLPDFEASLWSVDEDSVRVGPLSTKLNELVNCAFLK